MHGHNDAVGIDTGVAFERRLDMPPHVDRGEPRLEFDEIGDAGYALEVAQDPARYVGKIGGALAEVIVVQFAHPAGIDAYDLLIGKIDIHEPAIHLLFHRLDERAVLQRKDVGVENTRVAFADRCRHLVADAGNLLPRL